MKFVMFQMAEYLNLITRLRYRRRSFSGAGTARPWETAVPRARLFHNQGVRVDFHGYVDSL